MTIGEVLASTSLSGTARPVRVQQITERALDSDLVLYDPVRQRVHVLNGVAAFIWQACDGDQEIDWIAESLVELYPADKETIPSDVVVAVDKLIQEGLLRLPSSDLTDQK